MYETEPRQLGGVLDAGIRLYRAAFKGIVTTAAKGFGAIFVLESISEKIFGISSLSFDAANDMGGEDVIGYVLMLLLVLPLTAVTTLAIVQHLHAFAEGREDPGAGAYRVGLRRTPALIVLGILYGLAFTLGLLLLVIPGIWLSVALALGFYLLITEGLGPIDALNRSRNLVKGNWFRTAVLYTVATVLALVIQLGVVTIPAGITGFMMAGEAEIDSAWIMMLNLLNAIAQILSIPLAAALGLALTRDLVLRKSGDDLEARLDAV